MSKILLLIGDSNVKRWMPHLCETYQKIVAFAPAHNLEELPSALSKVSNAYQMVVFAGFSNIVVSSGESAQNSVDRLERIDTAISNVLGIIE